MENTDDLSEYYAAMNKEKQERHAEWKRLNTAVLKESGIPFRIAGPESFLFREPNKPVVDFYPSTGRWRTPKDGRTYRGGAKAFISWYKKQYV